MILAENDTSSVCRALCVVVTSKPHAPAPACLCRSASSPKTDNCSIWLGRCFCGRAANCGVGREVAGSSIACNIRWWDWPQTRNRLEKRPCTRWYSAARAPLESAGEAFLRCRRPLLQPKDADWSRLPHLRHTGFRHSKTDLWLAACCTSGTNEDKRKSLHKQKHKAQRISIGDKGAALSGPHNFHADSSSTPRPTATVISWQPGSWVAWALLRSEL